MADIIRLLPDNVANQIAAGEVVQRPASVVKELLENSVDSGATEIKLIARESGKAFLQVIDNGNGMNENDSRMAFERHATSKITKAEDIFSIITKGFRGEALASIAAVAQVDLRSRTDDSELGTHLKVAGNVVESQEFCSCAKGTNIEVRNLFFNIPARRNFLKSNQVEHRHIIDEFERVAMAHPDVAFSFEHNGSEIFNLPASTLRQRIVNIFGKKYNEKLVPVEESTEILSIHGFVGKPEFARKTRGEQFFFVNHRFIRNAYLHKAVQRAFEGLLHDDSYPSYFLYLELDPARIDVNIHPTKTEVKFDDERAIHTIIRSSVKHSLGQYNIAPSLDFDHDQQFVSYPKSGSVEAPGIYIDPTFNPFDKSKLSQGNPKEHSNYKAQSNYQRPESSQSKEWESLLGQIPEMPDSSSIQGQLIDNNVGFETQHKTYLQIGQKYILTKHGDGLILINQRRAQERILFEKILSALHNRQIPSQQLIFPQNVELNAADFALSLEILPKLRALGFDLDEFGKNQLVVHGVPLFIDNAPGNEVVENIIEAHKNFNDAGEADYHETMAQKMAKVAALRRGTLLEIQAMANLVDKLFASSSPYHSPDGKPIIVNLTLSDIDKSFN
jgi:DNA mismatch repair protein MutL